jgi:hypothetical protein
LQHTRSGKIATLVVILFTTSKYNFICDLLYLWISEAQFSQKRTDKAQGSLRMELARRLPSPERRPNGVKNKDIGKRGHEVKSSFILPFSNE